MDLVGIVHLQQMMVPLSHRRLGKFEMLIDDEDWDKIKHLNLTINFDSTPHTQYAKSRVYEKKPDGGFRYVKDLHVHRIIMGLGDYKEDRRMVNHINGNGLDNRKQNLELSDCLHNSQSWRQPNRVARRVSFDTSMKRLKRWRFSMKVNGVRHQKRFATEEDANAYAEAFIERIARENP